MFIIYTLLYDGDVSQTDLRQLIATNRNLPKNWCTQLFTDMPSTEFAGMPNALNVFLQHLKSAENDEKEKFQIVVDSDLDGIASAAILYRYLDEFYPDIETVYSLHSSKKHGLSKDIEIDKDTTLVWCPDSSTNEVEQCKTLSENGIDVICLDHHIIEQENPYAAIVSCMDGVYPNQNLCGSAVTWLFLWEYAYENESEHHLDFLLNCLDLVAVATIADVMEVTNKDNMYFIQNGLNYIHSHALKAFLIANEVNLNDVTIEDIKFKVAPLVSAMIRMGSMPEKDLLFRAFIDDYKEFEYEKRGSFDVAVENIYDRVVRLCKNAKSRQDRAKLKMLDECEIHEYPHVLLVEYKADKASPLTGLVANELASKYCKPCIVFKKTIENRGKYVELFDVGSIRNYDGSPISNFKELLEDSFLAGLSVQGHENSAGIRLCHVDPDITADLIATQLPDEVKARIGSKEYSVDFSIPADAVDAGFVKSLHVFDKYSGKGFPQVIALVTGIKVSQENFKTMGKNSFNWKISDGETGVSFVKFKINYTNDELVQCFDDINFDIGKESYYCCTVDAICTFGLNVFNGEIHPQCIVKDYCIVSYKNTGEYEDDFDFV